MKQKNNDFSFHNQINELFSSWWFILLACVVSSVILIFIGNFIYYGAVDMYRVIKRTLHFKDINVISNLFKVQISTHKPYYMALSGIITINIILVVYKMRTNFTPIKLQQQKGSREWTTLAEIQKQYKAVPRNGTFEGKGGIVISNYKDKIYIDDSAVNNLVIGTTRSGKGELIIIPTIDIHSRAEVQSSVIINDPKGEHCASGYQTLKNRGYDVYVLNLIDLTKSMGYNPLQNILDDYLKGDVDSAQLQTRTFSTMLFFDPTAKDKVWQNWSISLTNALILAHVIDCCEVGDYAKVNMYSVARLLATYSTIIVGKARTALDLFFQARPENDIARLQYATVLSADVRVKGSIYANTLSKLELFTYSQTARLTSTNQLNFLDIGFGEKPIAVFLCTPDYDTSLHFLASLFVKQMYYTLAKEATNHIGNKCTREVVVLLDEAGNMPPLPDFTSMITVGLGRNIRFTTVVQDYAQLDKLYGSDNAKTIKSNCGNQIYILTNDPKTAQDFSTLIGNETIVSATRNSSSILSLSKNRTEQTEGRPLLTSTELMELLPGETVVMRVIKRKDNKGKLVKPKPIFNTGVTRLMHRYEYINAEFDTSKALNECVNKSDYNQLDLENIVYSPDLEFGEPPEFTDTLMVSDILSGQQQEVLKKLVPDIELDLDNTVEDVIELFKNLYEGEAIKIGVFKMALRILQRSKTT